MARNARPLRAVGITCGIGSMLVGARRAGFEIEGNVEWRKYYHHRDQHGQNTFEANFPGAVFPFSREQMTEEEFRRFSNPDIALGHPECGNFSRLSSPLKSRAQKAMDPADIPLFCDLVALFRPRFFVMDDLPGSFAAFPMSEYVRRLPDYDLFPEWISNWGYGNTQRGRDRMFMLGALKKEKWAFRPGERMHDTKVRDVIGDLPKPRPRGNMPNHEPHQMEPLCARSRNLHKYGDRYTWAQMKEYFRDKPAGFTMEYEPSPGEIKARKADGRDPKVKRIGFLKGHWDGPAHVLTGGNATVHFHRLEPYTVRERARIQGFPDDFVFYGTVLDEWGYWNHDQNGHMIRQTGKAMPIQFCEFVSRQIMAHIRREPFECSGQRVKEPNELISQAKLQFCESVGYANQKAACQNCWLARTCELRTTRYGMPPLENNAPVSPGRVRKDAPATQVPLQAEPRKRRPPKESRPEVASKKRATSGGNFRPVPTKLL